MEAFRQVLDGTGMFAPLPAGHLVEPYNWQITFTGGGTGPFYGCHHVVSPQHNNQTGSGAAYMIRRNSAGNVDAAFLLYGGEGFTNLPIWVDFSQTGNTVTASFPGHGFTVGQQVGFLNVSGSIPSFTAGIATADNSQITLNNPTSRTAASTGLLYYGKNYATFSQAGVNVALTTLEAHGLSVGDRIYINVISQSSGTTVSAGFYRVVNVVSATQFVIEFGTSQTVASGVAGLRYCAFIPGTSLGGTSPANDMYVAMAQGTMGAVNPGSQWLKLISSGSGGIFNATTGAGKIYSSRIYYVAAGINGTTIDLWVRSACGAAAAQGSHLGYNWYSAPAGTGAAWGAQAMSNTTTICHVRGWRSQIDPNFRVFQFVTDEGNCPQLLVFHNWQPENPSVFDLNKWPVGGFTSIVKSDNRFAFVVPGYHNIGSLSLESSFSSTGLYHGDARANSWNSDYPAAYLVTHVKAYRPNTGGNHNHDGSAEIILFRNKATPVYDLTPGPFVTGIPFPPGVMPTFYTMPEDFALLPLGATQPTPGDTFTVSETEVWTVLMATAELAFVARTV